MILDAAEFAGLDGCKVAGNTEGLGPASIHRFCVYKGSCFAL